MTRIGDHIEFGPASDYRLLSIDVMLRLFRCGCEVHNYDCFIVIPESMYDLPLPAYLATTEKTTWRLWKDVHHYHQKSGSLYYIGTNSTTGSFLPSETLSDLCADGYTLITYPEMQAVQAQRRVHMETQ